MLAPVPNVLAGHRLSTGQLACLTHNTHGDDYLRPEVSAAVDIDALLSVRLATLVTWETCSAEASPRWQRRLNGVV